MAKPSTLATRLRSELRRQGLSQREFHGKVRDVSAGVRGSSLSAIRQYMSGEICSARQEILEAMAEVLGVRWEWLASGKGGRTERDEQVRVGKELGLSPDEVHHSLSSETPPVGWEAPAPPQESPRQDAPAQGSQYPAECPQWLRDAFRMGAEAGYANLSGNVKAQFVAVQEAFALASPGDLKPDDGRRVGSDEFGRNLWASLLVPFGLLGVDPDFADQRMGTYLVAALNAYVLAAQMAGAK